MGPRASRRRQARGRRQVGGAGHAAAPGNKVHGGFARHGVLEVGRWPLGGRDAHHHAGRGLLRIEFRAPGRARPQPWGDTRGPCALLRCGLLLAERGEPRGELEFGGRVERRSGLLGERERASQEPIRHLGARPAVLCHGDRNRHPEGPLHGPTPLLYAGQHGVGAGSLARSVEFRRGGDDEAVLLPERILHGRGLAPFRRRFDVVLWRRRLCAPTLGCAWNRQGNPPRSPCVVR
mmetsp:Transcript_69707/g.202299  ORF Transcript_69707/g.202299 Transcript_69707/m.202299 type:complete len:235 (-) Transcript_69707:785-1489(-)